MATRTFPLTSAALPAPLAQSTLRDRLLETVRGALQKSPLTSWSARVSAAPILPHSMVLYPGHVLPVAPDTIHARFHRIDAFARSPLVIVVALLDEDLPTLEGGGLIGTLGRIQLGKEEPRASAEDLASFDPAAILHVHGLRRVAIFDFPDDPRGVVTATPLQFRHEHTDALRDRFKGHFRAFFQKATGSDDLDNMVRLLSAEWLSYLVMTMVDLPLDKQHDVLRISDATELIEAAIAMMTAHAARAENSTG